MPDAVDDFLSKLFDFVSPMLVGIACILLLTYLLIELAQWNGDWNTQLLKIVIFVVSNLFFAAVIARNLYAFRQVDAEERIKRHQELKKVAPTLVFISIGLSICVKLHARRDNTVLGILGSNL